MPFTRTVQKYDAYLSPNSGGRSGRITLYCSDGILNVIFVGPAESLPSNSYDAAAKTGTAYQPMNLYLTYIDLLRNEKPIYANFITETSPPSFEIYCQNEPTGEAEK